MMVAGCIAAGMLNIQGGVCYMFNKADFIKRAFLFGKELKGTYTWDDFPQIFK